MLRGAPAASAQVSAYETPEPGATPDPSGTPEPGGTPEPAPTATPDPPPPARQGALAVGITEPNPNFMWARDERAVPAPFDRWRDELLEMRPHLYRLQVDWADLASGPDAPLGLGRPRHGCMRDKGPCAPWGGLRDQLAALAARQREGGWETVVAISGTPGWAARPPSGCERTGTQPRARPPRTDALPAYRRFVADLLEAARAAGAELRWWSAWNEPNHPYFLSPQRAACTPGSPSLAIKPYAEIHDALGEALDAAPGEQGRVIGDLAGTRAATGDVTAVTEFIAGLPRELVCGTTIWAQHAYFTSRDDADVAADALAARGCERPHEIWVTETGHRNAPREAAPVQRCRNLHARLLTWHADPRVTAAFQYTLREDDRFPYGLVTTGLEAAFPALGLWQSWGGLARPSPADAAPPVGTACFPPG